MLFKFLCLNIFRLVGFKFRCNIC